ncbi:MAG: phosphoribosylamine--glycine ligase [Chlamydiae bacterium CG10_big_fil_rev_8_21_14_0_10_35_9]|nr:MAG: phosphoribosylamine--glycine ligase [Chlamydiae bacterium CG10_big_fil_rev_8_21_14_0_10_35_9]
MKILVLGKGGREHALCKTFERQDHTVYSYPGNGGTHPILADIKDLHFASIVEFVKENNIDLTVVGGEDLLASGIKDYFEREGLLLFGPNKIAAQIESSKAWAKQFMQAHHVPTANFVVCKTIKEAKKTVEAFFESGKKVVVKPSGLTAGKGVIVCDTLSQAHLAIQLILSDKCFDSAGDTVVIEERLFGKEVSVMAFCDGVRAKIMIPAKDHKRLLENDKGPNTGGMGAFAPVEFLTEKDLQEIEQVIFQPVMQGFINQSISYQGVLYAGLMLTDAGPKVLEFNARFGDPEAQAVLPLLHSDLANIMIECCQGKLQSEVTWKAKASCCIVLASKGYPKSYQTGFPISGISEVEKSQDSFVFHSGTTIDDRGTIFTNGGRVLSVVSLGETSEEAKEKAYEQIKKIRFKGVYFRGDIAVKETLCLH